LFKAFKEEGVLTDYVDPKELKKPQGETEEDQPEPELSGNIDTTHHHKASSGEEERLLTETDV